MNSSHHCPLSSRIFGLFAAVNPEITVLIGSDERPYIIVSLKFLLYPVMSSIKSPVLVTCEGMFDAESCLESAIARSMASFVGSGGGLLDRSVIPSRSGSVGVRDRARRSCSVPSLCVFSFTDCRSSVSCRVRVDQSPDFGLALLLKLGGDADKGVMAPERISQVQHNNGSWLTQGGRNLRRRRRVHHIHSGSIASSQESSSTICGKI